MATLEQLKTALRAIPPLEAITPLSCEESCGGNAMITQQDALQQTYHDFIATQLTGLLEPFFASRSQVSVLEIDPGLITVLRVLPEPLRRKITKYVAHEPNTMCQSWLKTPTSKPIFPGLECPVSVYSDWFTSEGDSGDRGNDDDRFDVVLFCQSLHGDSYKSSYLRRALSMVTKRTRDEDSLVIVFHRGEPPKVDRIELYAHRTVLFPGVVCVDDNEAALARFATSIAGSAAKDDEQTAQRVETCRQLAFHLNEHPGQLNFHSPEIMVAFKGHCGASMNDATLEDIFPKVIIAVTGEHGAGKDTLAEVWASMLMKKGKTSRVESISAVTKREYAEAYDADLERLLHDREYKEARRKRMSDFYKLQLKARPKLLEEHFLSLVHGASDVDVLFITGMRDEALVTNYAPLVPDRRLLDIRVVASEAALRERRGFASDNGHDIGQSVGDMTRDDNNDEDDSASFADREYCPSFIFDNNVPGTELAEQFAKRRILPLVDEDLVATLATMVISEPDFPREGIMFRHVLNIVEDTTRYGVGGVRLCTKLLKALFHGDWSKICSVVTPEVGGFVFASPLALELDLTLTLIRKAGSLGEGRFPPPTVSVWKAPSHASSFPSAHEKFKAEAIEMNANLVGIGTDVVVIDDVLATGETMLAVLRLLRLTGMEDAEINVMVVAEFPLHRGRQMLREMGFGKVHIQSLLVFGGL